jgi:metallophosphoesterase superfamily enzyme
MNNHNNTGTIDRSLDRVLQEAPAVPVNDSSRWVIFSDLHLGNGGPKDDFKRNAPLFLRILDSYYLKKGFGLILNGDIEELQRFSLKKIVDRWMDVFALFRRFQAGPGLIKIAGNHDIELLSKTDLGMDIPVQEAVRLEYGRDSLLVFHGHQAQIGRASCRERV